MAEIAQQSPQGGRIRSKKLSTRIDMTPMVDLAFLLLTFFILTTQLMKPHAMDMLTPEKNGDESTPVNEKHVLTLLLGGNNTIYWRVGANSLQATDYSASGIQKILFENKAKIKVVLIKASDHSVYQNMVDIMDDIYIAEMQRYYVVDVTPDDEKAMSAVKGVSLVDKKQPFK